MNNNRAQYSFSYEEYLKQVKEPQPEFDFGDKEGLEAHIIQKLDYEIFKHLLFRNNIMAGHSDIFEYLAARFSISEEDYEELEEKFTYRFDTDLKCFIDTFLSERELSGEETIIFEYLKDTDNYNIFQYFDEYIYDCVEDELKKGVYKKGDNYKLLFECCKQFFVNYDLDFNSWKDLEKSIDNKFNNEFQEMFFDMFHDKYMELEKLYKEKVRKELDDEAKQEEEAQARMEKTLKRRG